jgi:hypothetical protein
VVAVPFVPKGFVTVLVGVEELVVVVGFRAAAAEDAVVFDGELLDAEGITDVRLAALVRGFFSSTELDVRCEELADVPAVALLAGFRIVEPAAGRAGGLLSPPVVAEVEVLAEVAVGFVADEAGIVPGRLAATKGLLGGTFSFLGLAAGEAFSVSVSTSDALAMGSSLVETSVTFPGASSGTAACGTSVSAILKMDRRLFDAIFVRIRIDWILSVGMPQEWVLTAMKNDLLARA